MRFRKLRKRNKFKIINKIYCLIVELESYLHNIFIKYQYNGNTSKSGLLHRLDSNDSLFFSDHAIRFIL